MTRLWIDVARMMIMKSKIDMSWTEGKNQVDDALINRGASTAMLIEVLHLALHLQAVSEITGMLLVNLFIYMG